MTVTEGFIAIVGLALLTVTTRGFFFLSRREIPIPDWLRQGLRYAPLAALGAVVLPEIVLDHGQLIDSWRNAQLFGAVAGLAWFLWRRDILGTILVGMAVMLPLRLGLGW
ncbi:MAG: AzlD domain-containing protein [Rubrivivax sp.]